jgi:hypothetical protein
MNSLSDHLVSVFCTLDHVLKSKDDVVWYKSYISQVSIFPVLFVCDELKSGYMV